MKTAFRLSLILVILLTAMPLPAVHAQDNSPWGEVFDENGNLRSDVVDLGVTTDTPSWMSVDLPFGQSLQLDADYHRFQTADGDVVIVPSASTLFFMAMNPKESGLADSAGMMSNGYGSVITFLGLVTGNSLDWNRLQQERPEYKDPSQFWNAVLNGKENAWTWFSGWGFITNLLSMSWNDADYIGAAEQRAEKVGSELVIPMVIFYFLPFLATLLVVIGWPIVAGLGSI